LKNTFNNFSKLIWLSLLLTGIAMSACRKEDTLYQGSASLNFSEDKILFDTLFTTIGSSTYILKVSNPYDDKLNIERIALARGSQSNFRMNVDGVSGITFNNVEIPAHDSIYIFVEVTIDPTATSTPYLITDSILFTTNGNLQDVDLIAYGRDAYFIIADRHIQGLPPFKIVAGEHTDTTWTSQKPIVIYGYAVVDSTATLRIEAGTEIYFHSAGGLWIYKGGCLKVTGTKDNPVIFDGDRPEDYFDDMPGQWDRIWINEGSVDNEINYAVIKNGFIGIQAEFLQEDMGNKIKISNTIIKNMSGVGIFARFSKIDAENLVVNNCQQYSVALTMGGNYEFRHSTLVNYWSESVRKTPALYLNNYYMDGNNTIYPFDLYARFYNSIVYGNMEDELVIDHAGGLADVKFENILARTTQNTSNSNIWVNTYKNLNPDFVSIDDQDFHLGPNSEVKEKGKAGIAPTTDLDGILRNVSTPSLGAYEFVVTP
jgi:hypothetical protein